MEVEEDAVAKTHKARLATSRTSTLPLQGTNLVITLILFYFIIFIVYFCLTKILIEVEAEMPKDDEAQKQAVGELLYNLIFAKSDPMLAGKITGTKIVLAAKIPL